MFKSIYFNFNVSDFKFRQGAVLSWEFNAITTFSINLLPIIMP